MRDDGLRLSALIYAASPSQATCYGYAQLSEGVINLGLTGPEPAALILRSGARGPRDPPCRQGFSFLTLLAIVRVSQRILPLGVQPTVRFYAEVFEVAFHLTCEGSTRGGRRLAKAARGSAALLMGTSDTEPARLALCAKQCKVSVAAVALGRSHTGSWILPTVLLSVTWRAL